MPAVEQVFFQGQRAYKIESIPLLLCKSKSTSPANENVWFDDKNQAGN
jgi:hypothetical protein